MKEIINEELSCNNCLEKARCKQQQEVNNQRINAILSYITNDENTEYIKELKNEIPSLTRCDVVLEKQLKRLEQENEKLKEEVENFKKMFEEQFEYKEINLKKIEKLKEEIKELKKYKNLFLKMKEFHFDERINNEKILKENEDLKDSIKRFTCQSECLRYKQYQQAKQALEEIREISTSYAHTESYIVDETFSEFLEVVFNKADEVLK